MRRETWSTIVAAVIGLGPFPVGSAQAPVSPPERHAQRIFGPANKGGAQSPSQPNIVFILTDDQDLHMNSLDYVPLIKKHLIDKGTLYKKHFCTTAICCPARVSILTGKLSHNTNVTDVSPPHGTFPAGRRGGRLLNRPGGYPKFIARGYNDAYLPVWLQEAGYNTYYTGKLFNAHHVDNYDAPFPKGWNGSVSSRAWPPRPLITWARL